MSSNYGVNIIIENNYDMAENYNISMAWTLWLLPLLASILISAQNFRRTMNLGGKRNDFLSGGLMGYSILAIVVSVATTIFDHIETTMVSRLAWGGIFTSGTVFGWANYGVLAEVIQQFAFLFLFSTFLHTLTAIQDKWYGWAVDVAIVAIISVFTPIAPLRASLVWFFRVILFSGPQTQIPACLILGLAIYSLNKGILSRKPI